MSEDSKCYEKKRRVEIWRARECLRGCNFKLGVRVSLTEEVTAEQRFKDMRKFLSYLVTWGDNTSKQKLGLNRPIC